MKSLITRIQPVSLEEKTWADSLVSAWASMHITAEGKEVLMLDQSHQHKRFNPSGSLKFYLAGLIVRSDKTFYSPRALPTGILVLDHGMQTISCVDGFLHDASGKPAMASTLFGDAYYLHGVNYEPIEYFRLLQKEKGRYPEYQPQTYIDYMASILGGKINP